MSQLRLELWTRTGRAIGADAAISLGQALMPSGPPDHVAAVLANRPAGEYVRQVAVAMPVSELASLAGVVAVLPARPVVTVPAPDRDAELGKLRARRSARAGRLGVWEGRVAEATGQLERIERDRAEAVDRGDDDASFADRRREQSGRLEDAGEAVRLLGGCWVRTWPLLTG